MKIGKILLVWAAFCVLVSACGAAGGDDGGTADTGIRLTGSLDTSAGGGSAENNLVMAQNNETGDISIGTTDSDGNFSVTLPESLTEKAVLGGSTYVITVLGANGQTIGTLTPGETSGGEKATGIVVSDGLNLGTIVVPANPSNTPLEPGADGEVTAAVIDDSVTARVDENNVPVGRNSYGKGDAAKLGADPTSNKADQDKDGLPDVLDADDDGDGLVDEFDDSTTAYGGPKDVRFGLFMNLKVQGEQSAPFYNSDPTARYDSLKNYTIITFETMKESGVSSTRTITSVRLLPAPAPSYISLMEVSGGTWSSSSYAFQQNTDRFSEWATPKALINAGDSFTVEISFDDGSKEYITRMINYVFKNIPRLVGYGADPGSLTSFSEFDAQANNSSNPIEFDGSQDLVLQFHPPMDELGSYLTNMEYNFSLFFYEAGGQGIVDIDWEATPGDQNITGFDGNSYRISAGDMPALAGDSTYTVTIPKALLPQSLETAAGTKTVGFIKIDITAERNSNNAAIMLIFKHQS